MPIYLGKVVSDEDLQELKQAYYDGMAAMGVTPPSSDQPILDRLAECGITKPAGADVVGRFDAIPSDQTHPE